MKDESFLHHDQKKKGDTGTRKRKRKMTERDEKNSVYFKLMVKQL